LALMKPRLSPVGFAIVCGLALLFSAGCATTRSGQPPTAVIAVSIAGGGSPTKQQVASIQSILRPEIEKHGYVLAPRSRADFIVSVRFTPDPIDSEKGLVAIIGVEPTPWRDPLRGGSAQESMVSDAATATSRALMEMGGR